MKNSTFFVFVVLLITACTSSKSSLENDRISTQVLETSSPTAIESIVSAAPSHCPVTTSINSFEAPQPHSAIAPWPGTFWFGFEHLWTALPVNGVWEGLPKNPGGYTQKIMWWSSLFSLKDELEPALVVFGRRLDAEAPPLKVYGATHAVADDIDEAMLTGVDFPTEGCWEVTGQYKKSGLTFVVWIAP